MWLIIKQSSYKEMIAAGPVAQTVQRWTPYGESMRPGLKGPRFEARQALDVYEPPGGYGYGWWQAVARQSQ